MADDGVFAPVWPLPRGVRAASTTRLGGASTGPYGAFNLGDHVGDDPRAVATNRARLIDALALPAQPLWLTQVHGAAVAGPDDPPGIEADARYADRAGAVCAVLTADCLPLLLCSEDGHEVAAVHCGWRGLAAGIVGNAVARFGAKPASLLAWLGPAIGPTAFEVGADVRDRFVVLDPANAACFVPGREQRWWANVPALTRGMLIAAGVQQITASGRCTVTESEHFYSYRRERVTGRMATLIWRDV